MTVVGWMVGASTIAWVAASFLGGRENSLEILLGMLGPLVAASATWVITERTYRRDAKSLTALMIKAFAVKMVFFAAYVATVIKALTPRPGPPVAFIVSFTTYFIALHLTEALCLRRLFELRPDAPR
jgi:hypothetical protein